MNPADNVELPKKVAPFAGAWIEISLIYYILESKKVAPFAGAWIEIKISLLKNIKPFESHPSRVRGLK